MKSDPALRSLALSLLICIAAVLLWNHRWQPAQQQAWQELRSRQAQLDDAIGIAPLADSELERLASELSASRAELETVRARYPSGISEAALLRELERRTRIHRLTIRALTIAPSTSPPETIRWTVDVRLTGKYDNLMAFASSLETGERTEALASMLLRNGGDPDALEMDLRYLLNSRPPPEPASDRSVPASSEGWRER